MLQFCSHHIAQRDSTGPLHVPHSIRPRRDTLLLLCSNYTQNISLYQDAGSFGFDLLYHLVPVQRRWSFVMIHGHLTGCRRLSSSACEGHFSTPSPFKLWMDDTLVYDSLFLCACLLKVYNCVPAFQLYIKLSGSLFVVRKG